MMVQFLLVAVQLNYIHLMEQVVVMVHLTLVYIILKIVLMQEVKNYVKRSFYLDL